MSSLAALPTRTSGARLRVFATPAGAVALGWVLFALLTLPKTLEVWLTGVFHNPDDAMRAVEVRDLMAGQGWFDLVPHRLSPDHPFAMHWSRLLDLPLAMLVRSLELVLPRQADAELAMRLLEPNLLFILSTATIVGLVRRLIGPAAMLPAALLLGGSIEFVGSFIPGHIHHHGIQATLILGATKLLIDALDTEALQNAAPAYGMVAHRAAFRAFASGACGALSLGIGLQNLPFVIGLAAAVALAWVAAGRRQAGTLRGFGAGLACVSLVVFVLDVAPSHYATVACDAFSIAHLVAAWTAGVAFLVLAQFEDRSQSVRLLLALVAAGVVLGAVAVAAPACLHDPMNGVDPLLRSQWLAEVGEALPLYGLIARDPFAGLALLATLCCGGAATFAAGFQLRRSGWFVLGLLSAVGFAVTLWQVRAAPTTCALMVPGVAWAILAILRRVGRDPKRPALLLATVAGMVGNGSALTAAATAIERHGAAPSHAAGGRLAAPARCFEPQAFDDLKTLPPGLVLSTIDPGSAMLAYTDHAVLAAPYHRNSYGNRVALLALNAAPQDALPLIRDSRARYLALCRTSNETIDSAKTNPGSLSAAVLDGRIPAWLTPLPSRGVYLLFRIADEAPPPP